MNTNMVLFVVFLFFFCVTQLGFADCTGLGNSERWEVQDDGTIIFYVKDVPWAKIELQDCTPDSSSKIHLLKSFVCEGDEILVDGERCKIITLKSIE